MLSNHRKIVFICIHGLGAHSGRWDFFVVFCKKHDIQCITPDFPPQGPLGTWEKIINETVTSATLSDQQVFLIGESLGGLMAYNYCLRNGAHNPARRSSPLSGIVLLSPAFKNIMPFSLLKYLRIVLGLLLPFIKTKAPFSATMCTRDGGYQQKMKQSTTETRNFSSQLYLDILFQQAYAFFKPIKRLEYVTASLSGCQSLKSKKPTESTSQIPFRE